LFHYFENFARAQNTKSVDLCQNSDKLLKRRARKGW